MDSNREGSGRNLVRGKIMKYFFTVGVALCVILFCAYLVLQPEKLSAQQKVADPGGALGVRAGVYNNGQAALWDLHIIDHFRYFGPPERARGHRPEQPIAFSHVTHVGNNKMECQFCHWSVNKAAFAAIPEVSICMGCHAALIDPKKVTKPDLYEKEIAKLKDYFDKEEPVPWIKVHVMPDYVRFSHKRHVKGGVTCQECHGQVPEMEVVERVSSMKMGWCISCHRDRGTSIDCATCHN